MLLRIVSVASLALMLGAGAASAASRTYDLPPFDQVSVSSGIGAVIDVGGSQSVTAESSTDAILQRLDVHVTGGRLEIGFQWNVLDWLFNQGETRSVTVHISAPALRGADASSGADVDVHAMSGDTLTVGSSSGASLSADGVAGGYVTLNSSSGASLTVKGTCRKLIANVSSGANLDAQGLACADVNADSSSGGHSSVRASASVNANASSGGSITVYGKPANTKADSSIGGSVSYAD